MKRVLVIFDHIYYSIGEEIDIFEIDDFVTLEYFVKNFEKFGHVGFPDIVSAHIVTESLNKLY